MKNFPRSSTTVSLKKLICSRWIICLIVIPGTWGSLAGQQAMSPQQHRLLMDLLPVPLQEQYRGEAAFDPTVCPKDSSRLKYAPGVTMGQLETYTYNSVGQLSLTERTDLSGNQKTITRLSLEYDAAGRITRELGSIQSGSVFLPNTRKSYTYTTAGNLQASALEGYNGTSWQLLNRSDYTYDAAGNRLSRTDYNVSTQTVTPVSRITYTYNNASHLTSELTETYSAGNWKLQGAVNYTVNSAGVITRYMTFVSTWSNSLEPQTTYNLFYNGVYLNSMIVTNWNYQSQSWDNSSRSSFTYDLLGRLALHVVDSWNGTWKPQIQNAYNYDNRDLLIYMLKQVSVNANWESSRQVSYTYDQNGNLTLERSENYDLTGAQWNLDTERRVYYNCSVTGLSNEKKSPGMVIFPNPAQDKVFVRTDESLRYIRLRDAVGKIVLEIQGQESLGLETLSPGFYLLEAQSQNGSCYTFKVVKE